jgi:hypothetical protein
VKAIWQAVQLVLERGRRAPVAARMGIVRQHTDAADNREDSDDGTENSETVLRWADLVCGNIGAATSVW